MRFISIKPAEDKVEFVEHETPQDGIEALGIDRMRTDHGVLWHGLAIIVYEFGLLEPDRQMYWSLGRQLFEGNAICYHYDQQGDTVDVTDLDLQLVTKHIAFWKSRQAAQMAIHFGLVQRPQTSINGAVIWEWDEGKGTQQ